MSIIITGANSGLGFETARQLAKLDADAGVRKLIITARSQSKADGAIESLVEQTGRPRDFFSSLVIETNDLDMCRAAAEAAPADLKGVILNAGGWGSDEVLPTGVMHAFGQNVLGHAVLVEELLAKNKLPKGARVVFVGSFAARGSDAVGLPRPVVKDVTDSKEWAGYMDGSGFEKYDQGTSYQYTKAIGALYMGKLAREHPDVLFFTVSPGACTDTNGHTNAKGFMRYVIPLSLKIMRWMGRAQSAADGSRRFVQAVTGRDFPFASGTFVGSKQGMIGELGDQAAHWDVFANEQAQDAATEALRVFINKYRGSN
eukprot:TRINITY_DN84258_c0_g1_i1.p1 TRINITY_DN84258_c0_g1~~TRINITY_DN84258_c0_g1_i1.p1  ORF type:complete len:315 (-),score=121.39 TRINITY_DN84258_c0_g1_i1:74-1018(-)